MSKQCDVCNLTLLDDYAFQGHLSGKKHLKNVKQKEHTTGIAARSIFVTWGQCRFSPEDLVQYLTKFGAICRYKFGPHFNYAIIQFKESKPVDVLLNTKIYLHGTKLEIKPRIVHKNNAVQKQKNKTIVEEEKSEICFDNLKSIFEQECTFDNQLSLFLNTISLNDMEIEKQYESVCINLNLLFQQSFPNCKTYRFGSTVTGLCFKKCDLDIYMNIGEPLSNDDSDKYSYVWTYKKVFAEAKRLLYRKPNLFDKVIPIPKAKTPIIKFCYVPTSTACDLSFRNSLGVHNSLLIKHYLSFDPRLKPLMMIIKYWAKNFHISTEIRGGRITNYSLVMLFIFYLEQANVNLVPPIIRLQRFCKPQIIDGWQVNFNENFRHPTAANKSTILELLHGFYDFYANFDFKHNVICPVDGKVYTKDIFLDKNNLPESMDRYKEYVKNNENAFLLNVQKPMCVQDPNELNHNSTANVSVFLLEIFQKHCSVSAEVCFNALTKGCSRVLFNLFTTMPEITKHKVKKVSIVISLQKFLKAGLFNYFETPTDTSDKEKFVQENIFNIVFTIVKDIFERVYKLKVQLSAVDREQKQQKVEVESDVHSTDNHKIILQCTGDRCFWKNRKCKSLILDPSYSILEKEVIISDTMVKNSKQNDDPVNLSVKCSFEKKQNPLKVVLILNDNDSGKVFNEFANILKIKIPGIVDKTLLHMLQYKKTSITFDRPGDVNTNQCTA